jgi:ribosomal RNA-processing protein 17
MAPHAKRRKVESAVAEISFDPAARHEYLTGFHKRKLQRTKQAQEYAEMKAREERRQARKKVLFLLS